jgi:3-polyprenyl-4-hydroxybenzoate decarboxylase
LAVFAAEHEGLCDIAIQSLTAIKTGNIGISGATGTLLAHALEELRSLTERTLPQIVVASPSAKAVLAGNSKMMEKARPSPSK